MSGPMRLSHSQQKSLHGCTLSWWISRRAGGRSAKGWGMPGTTYWSTLAGSVFHERIEYFLTEGEWPEESIRAHLQRLVDDHLWDTPYTMEDIRTSKLPPGLKVTDHPNGFDFDAVVQAVPLWIAKWRGWWEARQAEGWELWWYDPGDGITQALPASEVEVNYTLGGHPVVGSIDCVMVHPDLGIWLVDWKAGRSKPDDTSQLDGYRIGFEERFGIRPSRAGFYMARTGQEHLTADLPTFTRAMLDVKFREAGERALRAEAGDFEVDKRECQYLCSVRAFCPLQGGVYSGAVRLPDPAVRGSR